MKNKSLGLVIGVLLALSFIFVPLVSAWDWDNVKTTAPSDSKYPIVKIKNALGLGVDISETELIYNTEYCNQNCYTEFKTILYSTDSLMSDIKFKKLDKSWKDTSIPNYKVLLGDYVKKSQMVCTPTGKNLINGSIERECTVIGVDNLVYTDYKGENLVAGTYYWKIEGSKVNAKDVIDFIPYFQGVEASEFAVWNYSVTEFYNDTAKPQTYSNVNAVGKWYAQGFTIGVVGANVKQNVSNITVPLTILTAGTGTITFEIKATAADDKPTGAALSTGTIDKALVDQTGNYYWYNIKMTQYELQPTTKYWLVMYVDDAGGTPRWQGRTNAVYTGGNWSESSDSGSSWTTYDNPDFEFYIIQNQSLPDTLTITLNSPVNNYNTSLTSVNFNCSGTATGGGTVTNISLYHNISGTWVRNQTLTYSAATATSYFTVSNIPDGSFAWNCKVCSSALGCNSSENRTVNIDTTIPTINLNLPAGTYGTLNSGYSLELNWTVSDSALSSCWYNYNSTNVSIACSLNTTNINYSIGYNSLTFYANDTFGNIGSSVTNWNYLLLVNSQVYNSSSYESTNESLTIRLNYNSSAYSSISALFNYQNISYAIYTTTINDYPNFTQTVVLPGVATDTITSFYWSILLTNSSGTFYYNTSSLNVTVLRSTGLEINSTCPTGYSAALNFSFFYENNLSVANGTANIYFTYGIANSSTKSINETIASSQSFAICINNSQPYYTIGEGQIWYSNTGTVDRIYYVFSSTRITNITVDIPLYELDSSASTSFLFTAQATTLTPYNGYYISLLRWYPQINSYRTVDMGRTDNKGQTVLRMKTEDVDYRIGLYDKQGNLVKLYDAVRFICQTSPCQYTLYVDTSQLDLTTFLNIQRNLSFDYTTKKFTFVWNDPSQSLQVINLTVFQDGGTGSAVICSQVGSGYTGVLICDVSAYTGTLRAEVYRTASPTNALDELIIIFKVGITSTSDGKTLGLFFALILALFLGLIGVFSPIAAIILTIIALIPAVLMGSISFIVLTALLVIGGILFHFMKRVG